MAVIEENPYIDADGVKHEGKVRHYSDEGKNIVQLETGKVYEEAVDVAPCPYTYAEYEDAEPDVPDAETEGLVS